MVGKFLLAGGRGGVDSKAHINEFYALEKTPPRRPVSCEIDGKTYKGTYWVAGKILTVSTGLGGKSKQVGTVPDGILAEQLLKLLAKDGKA